MPPIINKDKCKLCGKCADACPTEVFYASPKGGVPIVTYPDECWHCNACVVACPQDGAIRLRVALPLMMMYQTRSR